MLTLGCLSYSWNLEFYVQDPMFKHLLGDLIRPVVCSKLNLEL